MTSVVPYRRTSASYVFNHGSNYQYLHLRHPQLALRDFAIAEAAAKAGFDCGSWRKLKGLIDAVRNAESPLHPDHWPSLGIWNSTISHERYHAEIQRARKGVAQAYKDADRAHRATTVPAFVVPARQLIDNISNGAYYSGRTNTPSRKRGHGYFIDHNQDPRKRLKIERPSQSQYSSLARTSVYIDLTQDEQVKTPSQNMATSRLAFRDISNNIPRPCTGKQSAKKQCKRTQEQRYRYIDVVQENRVNDETQQTNAIIARIASRLQTTAAEIDTDREVLRQRWEVDDELKDRAVTDNLAELNECFTRAEEAVIDGIGIIEENLLSRR